MRGEFMSPPELPAGVEELFLLTKYHVDYAAPRFERGARVRGTGGYKIFTADGAPVSTTIAPHSTLEEWRSILGRVLDVDIRIRERGLADPFRDPLSRR